MTVEQEAVTRQLFRVRCVTDKVGTWVLLIIKEYGYIRLKTLAVWEPELITDKAASGHA